MGKTSHINEICQDTRNVYCDQCQKCVGDEKLVYFSDVEKDLDFCSEECYSTWTKEGNWESIHPDFTLELKKQWKGLNFNYETCQSWINFGCQPQEVGLVIYLSWCQYYKLNNDIEKARIEYSIWKDLGLTFGWQDVMLWKSKNFTLEQTKQWLIAGLQSNDHDFARYLNSRGCKPHQENLNLDEWRTKWAEVSQKSQQWLESQEWYNTKEKRAKIEEIYLTEPSLEGELDLSEFTYSDYVSGVKVYIYLQVDASKLSFANQPAKARIIKLVQAQEWLNTNYPLVGGCIRENETDGWGNKINNQGKTRDQITGSYISYQGLFGELNFKGFSNLTYLDCSDNQLTKLELDNGDNLTGLSCSDNQLTSLDFLSKLNPHKLTSLNIKNNNFPTSDLKVFSHLVNLASLWIGSDKQEKIKQGIANRFIGSLTPLQSLTKLRELSIENTDLNEVDVDNLPKSLEEIIFSVYQKSSCKLTEIIPQLEKIRYGWCSKCKQLNTSKNWCQFCADEELKQLSGQGLVEKFIQLQQLREDRKQKGQQYYLKLIPYEEFTDIEYLSKGGFSEIHKAKWKTEERNIVLKTLISCQNVTLEFLQEVAYNAILTKHVFGVLGIEGISQEPETGNYLMVMGYMRKGNLRQCLQNQIDKLNLKNKFEKLWCIISGLYSIHKKNLIHKDLHSGNILNDITDYHGCSYSDITDLGLSQSTNYQKEGGKIFGVLPYVAPEVLQGQPYTQASDIYSFGIIAYELFANSYPYSELACTELALAVCQGLRPNIEELKVPELLKVLIERCWDANVERRPTSGELYNIINKWWEWKTDRTSPSSYYEIRKNTQFYQQYETLETEYNQFFQNVPYKIHSTAVIVSEVIDTKEIVRLLQESKEQALEQEIKKIEQEIDQPLTDGMKRLVSDFIQTRKKLTKDKKNKEIKKEVWKLEDRLKEKGFLQENIDKIILYCDRLVEQLEKLQLQAQVEIPTNK